MIADKNHLIVFQELIDKDLVSVDVQGRVGWYCFLNVIEWVNKSWRPAPPGCGWLGVAGPGASQLFAGDPRSLESAANQRPRLAPADQ